MTIKQFTFNHFGVNCFVLSNEETKQCAIVDPAAERAYEDDQLQQYLDKQQLTPCMILLTHAHVDHIAGLREVCERYHLPVSLHPDGIKLLRQAEAYGSIMGFEVGRLDDLPTHPLSDGEVLSIGTETLECRYVPGHCPGSLCYVQHTDRFVLTGDALFRGSIGRTDLPGGDYEALITHLRDKILSLDDDFQVLPGHGELSTIGEEHLYNGFLS